MKTLTPKNLGIHARTTEEFFLRRRMFLTDDYDEKFHRHLWLQRLHQPTCRNAEGTEKRSLV